MVISYTPIVFYTHYHEPTPQFIRAFTPHVEHLHLSFNSVDYSCLSDKIGNLNFGPVIANYNDHSIIY